MNESHDLVFTASGHATKARVEGKLYIAATKTTYRALSGSTKLKPLPQGGYIASNLATREKAEMALPVHPSENGGGGMCFPAWSVQLEPLFCTSRTLLRIHPDGNFLGTEGCIGILDNVHKCYEDLKVAFSQKKDLLLLVNHNGKNT